MKALSQLPAATKDRLFPLIVARPWPNANHLGRTWGKIGEALGNRRYALDLDPTKQNAGGDKTAAVEFDRLFESRDGFSNYYDVVSEINEALPVLQISHGSAMYFDAQANHINHLDRGLIVRIQYGIVNNPLALVDQVLDKFQQDVCIFVDVGWSRNILGREMWASNIIERISGNYPEIEIVVTGSSFPESFVDFGERGSIEVEERFLYNNLVRRHNSAKLIYGDWGSTRPPSDPVPMRSIPRIDLPTPNKWISFRRSRDSDDEEDYSDIAQRVLADSEWPADLNIWGKYVIDWTANGEPGAIRSQGTAAAARINIHLHRQAFFGGYDIISDGDEPFID